MCITPHHQKRQGVKARTSSAAKAPVDEIIEEVKKAGATILKPAATKQWGGYGGSFADPDGYIWDSGHSARGKNQPYAE
jgi:uncharacterized protein